MKKSVVVGLLSSVFLLSACREDETYDTIQFYKYDLSTSWKIMSITKDGVDIGNGSLYNLCANGKDVRAYVRYEDTNKFDGASILYEPTAVPDSCGVQSLNQFQAHLDREKLTMDFGTETINATIVKLKNGELILEYELTGGAGSDYWGLGGGKYREVLKH